MNTIIGVAIALTVMILAYILRKPALKWVFCRDQPETPEGWEPKMITWTNGVRQ